MLGKKIALGTANFGMSYGVFKSKISKVGNIRGILQLCKKNNIDTIDTSIDYNKAEEVLGKSGCKSFNIVTKLPKPDKSKFISANKLETIILNSLVKLKKNSLYALLFRDPKTILDLDYIDIWRSAKILKQKGIIRKLGISIYNPKELDAVLDILKPDLVQVPYNFFDRRIEYSGWMSKLFQQNIEIHSRSIFLQGLLLKKKNELPKKFLKYEKIWENYQSWLNKNNISALEACINFVSEKREISKIILGIDNIEQLNEIISVREKRPDFSTWKESISEDLIDPRKW